MTRAPHVIFVGGDVDATRRTRPSGHPLLGRVMVLIVPVVVLAALVNVTVPLLWPVGATLAAVLFLAWGMRQRAAARPAVFRDPYTPERPPSVPTGTGYGTAVRIGDAERDQALEALREHTACGRLTAEEFEDRCEQVLAARTLTDLTETVHDLPELPRREVR